MASRASDPIAPFRPFPGLANPHVQTILAARLVLPLEPRSERRIVDLADGDRLSVHLTRPPAWRAGAPVAILAHGLCGSHRSPYLQRIASVLAARGVLAIRVNLRGCGSGRGLARRPYHSGRSEDLFAVARWAGVEAPGSPLTLAGFSLSGNVALKLAAELGSEANALFARVVAVSPPVDLAACAERLARRENRVYHSYFVRALVRDIRDRERLFPDIGRTELPRRVTLVGIDDTYTAPRSGFMDARDYYARCSAGPLLGKITVPTRVLYAADDPLVAAAPLDAIPRGGPFEVTRTERGGHMGFLGWGTLRWLDAWAVAAIASPSARPPGG